MIGFDRSRDGSTLVIQAGSTTTTEAWLLDLNRPTSAPVPAGGRHTGVDYEVEHAGDRLLIVHNDGAPSFALAQAPLTRSEEHTSELQSRGHLVCRLLLEKKKHRQLRT